MDWAHIFLHLVLAVIPRRWILCHSNYEIPCGEAIMSNEDQIEFWNGEAGERWARDDAIMERLLQPVTTALLDHASLESSTNALDIGCGGGSQSIQLAQRMKASGKVLGIDISAPMLAVAAGKAASREPGEASLEFQQTDASTYAYDPGSFDLLFSRFGVMFFDDPVSAFSNLRGALQKGGRLAFCCWQSLKDNAWTLIPLQAALKHVAPPEKSDPNAPGPFAFADPERVTGILSEAGFDNIQLESYNATLRFSEADSLAASIRGLAEMGPISKLIMDQADDVKERVFGSMEEVLQPYFQDGALLMPVAIWFVTADAA
jgi:ubiquinone/menaquinone biosynthesis C-methylase UbiE